nr:urease accessory UreF family protein [Frankia nepalensis]
MAGHGPNGGHGPSSGARAALLVLADGRLPAGGHAHSGGVEAAVVDGGLTSVDDLAAFLRGRLATAGLLAASFAAAACRACQPELPVVPEGPGRPGPTAGADPLAALDAELDARTPSPAQREASRAQGRTLLRAGRAAWELPAGITLPPAPHHPVALGVVAAAAGLAPADAALAAVYGAASGPASAATRLLGLDPLAVTGLLARLAGELERVAAEAAAAAATAGSAADLPAPSAVRLDLLAERHRVAPVRMFAS